MPSLYYVVLIHHSRILKLRIISAGSRSIRYYQGQPTSQGIVVLGLIQYLLAHGKSGTNFFVIVLFLDIEQNCTAAELPPETEADGQICEEMRQLQALVSTQTGNKPTQGTILIGPSNV